MKFAFGLDLFLVFVVLLVRYFSLGSRVGKNGKESLNNFPDCVRNLNEGKYGLCDVSFCATAVLKSA